MTCGRTHVKGCERKLPFTAKVCNSRTPSARPFLRKRARSACSTLTRSTTRRRRDPSLAVLNVCVGAIPARAHRTALAHGILRVRSGAFLHGALLAFREHTCVSLCLMAVIFPRAFPQSRAAADQYASLLSTPACFSLPRDCPILRPRAGLPLSSGGHATLRSR